MQYNDNKVWEELLEGTTVEDLIKHYSNPYPFQKEFKRIIDSYCFPDAKIIEVGCETGITSCILNNDYKKTFFDLNKSAIKIAEELCKHLNINADFIVGDMFDMPFENQSFDVVFNAGVLEHFGEDEISAALTEYKRVLKDEGVIVIGIPNHFSKPYRAAYLFLNFLNNFKIKGWKYPKENKIYDLKCQADRTGLVLVSRFTISKEDSMNWWNFAPIVKYFYELLDRVFNFEGYLTVLIYKKLIKH